MEYRELAKELLVIAEGILATAKSANDPEFESLKDDLWLRVDIIRKKIKISDFISNTFSSVAVQIPTTYNGPRYRRQWIEQFEEVVWELNFISKN